jgi:hypothetical protein
MPKRKTVDELARESRYWGKINHLLRNPHLAHVDLEVPHDDKPNCFGTLAYVSGVQDEIARISDNEIKEWCQREFGMDPNEVYCPYNPSPVDGPGFIEQTRFMYFLSNSPSIEEVQPDQARDCLITFWEHYENGFAISHGGILLGPHYKSNLNMFQQIGNDNDFELIRALPDHPQLKGKTVRYFEIND